MSYRLEQQWLISTQLEVLQGSQDSELIGSQHAVNRCRSNNASLAVFDDDVRQNFPSSLLSDNVKAWIGLMKSWWTWPGLLLLLFIIIIYNIFGCIVGES